MSINTTRWEFKGHPYFQEFCFDDGYCALEYGEDVEFVQCAGDSDVAREVVRKLNSYDGLLTAARAALDFMGKVPNDQFADLEIYGGLDAFHQLEDAIAATEATNAH